MVLAIAMISGYKQSGQNEIAEKHAKPATPKDLKNISKPDVRESKADMEFFTPIKSPAGKPRILLILTNDTGVAKWSPALWWNYQHATPGQPGC